MQIIKGKLQSPQKLVGYGPEGIGKSTFASCCPAPLFIDTEGSTTRLDVARTPAPSSWSMLKQIINEILKDHMGFQTLVIDTADWAERLGISEMCAKHHLTSLGGQDDFGKSFNMWAQEFGKFLDLLTDVRDSGMHVVLLAHAQMKRAEQPEEFGSYDRWELKLEKKTSALLKEWADTLLFFNYKTLVIEDSKTHTKKGQGGSRVMHTVHHPCWDAKNRDGLKSELPFDFASVAHLFESTVKEQPKTETPPLPAATPAPKKEPEPDLPSPAHKKAADLMKMHGITYDQVLDVIVAKGYHPKGTPFENLPADFVEGWMVTYFDKIVATVKQKGVA